MQSESQKNNWSEAKQARIVALSRQRRIIFNDDAEDFAHPGSDTVEGFLAPRLAPLAGTQVDTIAWSVLANWGDAPGYASKVQPIHGEAQGGPPPGFVPYVVNLEAMIDAGHDPLQVVIDFAHDNGMEAFASVRMNDQHDSFVEGLQTIWKQQHPELLVDTTGMLPRMQIYVTAQDYTHEQVRQRKLEIIEEICQRYDVDGFELDYFRHPAFFSRTLRGEPVTDEEIQIMTSFMRQIRQITDEAAARRGRPILIATRVPDSFELSKNIGLDLQAWLEEDLVDILIAGGGYAPFSLPVAEFTEAAHQYGALVYPCINQGAAEGVSGGAFLEGVRALAANWYQAGADGVYTWNLACPFMPDRSKIDPKTGQHLINAEEMVRTRQRCYACLDEIGDPQALVGKDKVFCVDGSAGSNYGFVSAQTPLPMTSKQDYPGVMGRVPLMVADDVEAASENGTLGEVKLTMDFIGPDRTEGLLFLLNGEPLTDGEFVATNAEKSEYQISYLVTAPPLKMGRNFIQVSLEGGWADLIKPVVQLSGLRLKVEYRAAE